MQNKYWLQSKTILFNIATLAMCIVAVLGAFGITPETGTVSKATSIPEDIAKIMLAISPIVNIYLRKKTVQGIRFK